MLIEPDAGADLGHDRRERGLAEFRRERGPAPFVFLSGGRNRRRDPMRIKTSLAALGMMGALAAATPSPTLAQGVHVGPSGVDVDTGRPGWRHDRGYRGYAYERGFRARLSLTKPRHTRGFL
jgi:hypothetical protein